MRKRLYEIIEAAQEDDKFSAAYDWFMMAAILISILPLAFHKVNAGFILIDRITVVIFIIDYILRLLTADLKLKKGAASFVLYPITPMAIIDLVSILPSLTILHGGFRLLRIFRLLRTFKAFRAFKIIRYSKSINMIIDVIKMQRKSLGTVAGLTVAYVAFSALVIFNVEPQSFDTFFEAFYWAMVSLATVGYGDIYPVTTVGRIVTIVSSVLGIAIVALPAGIITAGFMELLREQSEAAPAAPAADAAESAGEQPDD
ncbi:MAG: ion transporter [Clostridia bacterium]|nr:ion transporter [Clostridia bacterium]